MGNQLVRFGGDWVTAIGTNGTSTMQYSCNGGQHYFGTTGSFKIAINDSISGLSSPFTINRRTASPANDWELMFGGAFFTPNILHALVS